MKQTPTKPEFTGVVIACEEGGFSAFCPQIKGAVSEGETEEEALENLKDAILGVLAVNTEMAGECLASSSGGRGGRPAANTTVLEFV